MALLLRHQPARGGLRLDDAGWASVQALVEALGRIGSSVGHKDVVRVVAESDKQRYVLSADGERIRAQQGHSVPVDLGLSPVVPPATLYHGTVAGALSGIRRDGLLPRGRHHVHLSGDPATANQVGARRGRPVLLEVAAGAMAQSGHHFYRSGNGVWLTDQVPPRFLAFPSP